MYSLTTMSGRAGDWIGITLFVSAAAFLGGCGADLKNVSSGEIGCAPKDIEIQDDSGYFGNSRTWTAVCNGKEYFCSAAGNHASCKAAGGE